MADRGDGNVQRNACCADITPAVGRGDEIAGRSEAITLSQHREAVLVGTIGFAVEVAENVVYAFLRGQSPERPFEGLAQAIAHAHLTGPDEMGFLGDANPHHFTPGVELPRSREVPRSPQQRASRLLPSALKLAQVVPAPSEQDVRIEAMIQRGQPRPRGLT